MKLSAGGYIRSTLIFSLLFCARIGTAQKIDTTSVLTISGYVDAYYAHYTDSVGFDKPEKFPTVSPRNDAPSLNILRLSFDYSSDKIRATGVLHYGDIANFIWPRPYNAVMEAHVGVKLLPKLWIDGGFFRSHFGTEYILPVESPTSSVAVATSYEITYESGIKLTWDPTKKLDINLFLLNGYGVFVENNNKKSLGVAVNYIVNDNCSLGYTNYVGDDTPPGITTPHLRIMQNVLVNYQYKKLKILAGVDWCHQQNSDIATGSKYANHITFLLTPKYQFTPKCAAYCRGETFNDPDGVMSGTITDRKGKTTGLKLWGATAGVEYKPTDESYVRLEARKIQMDADQYIFYHDGTTYNYRYEIMLNAGITFDVLKNYITRKTN